MAIEATVLTSTAAVMTGMAAAASVLAKWLAEKYLKVTVSAPEPGRVTQDLEVDSRLVDAKRTLRRQEFIATWSGVANAGLTFGQYIIGGVLASSFVQQNLPVEIVGTLGVLVLFSALVHQRYRPDLQASSARHRAVRLRVLIRAVEDDLFAMRSNNSAAPTIYDVRQKVSRELGRVEESELIDSAARQVDTALSGNGPRPGGGPPPKPPEPAPAPIINGEPTK